MKAGRELILLASVLFLLLINLSGSDDSLLFSFQENQSSYYDDYVEIVNEGKASLLELSLARKTFIIKNGIPLEKGDSLHVTKEGIFRGRMKGGSLLLLGLPINVNEAGVEDLTAISGIGPKTAEAIVKFREKQGPFRSLSDLLKVKGIGKKRLAKMEKLVIL